MVTNPRSMFARLLKAKYFPLSSFIEVLLGPKPLPIWLSILWGGDLFMKGLGWLIGDGLKVNIQKDNWIS